MTSYCEVTNSLYPVTMTTIRHYSMLEVGREAYNQEVAPGITRPLHATAPRDAGAGPSPAGWAVVPAPQFEIGAPHFMFGPLVATYIQYCIFKMWPPLLVFGLSFWFLDPLLVNPGDGIVLKRGGMMVVFMSQNC